MTWKHRRLLPLLAVLGAAVPVAGAHASAAGHCPAQVTDIRGDAYDWMLPSHPALPEGDVVAVDIAPQGSALAFTWHMAAVSATPTRAIQLAIIFEVNQRRYYDVSIAHAVDGNDFQDAQWDDANGADVQGSIHDINGSLDTSAGTLTALVPMADLGVSRSAAFYDLHGFASEDVGISAAGLGEIVDNYNSIRPYYLGKSHC